MSSNNTLILPRPGQTTGSTQKPIPGPSEADFTNTFGNLLPAAKFLSTTNGKAAYYELLPTSEPAQRILLIHGVQTPAIGMIPLAKTLQKGLPQAHIALVDLWGHGLSDTPIVPHEASLFHQLIDAVLDRLEWPSAHIVGFSFGGALTTGYVASRPSRVQSFVLVAPAGLLCASDFSDEEQRLLKGEDEEAAKKWVLEFLEGGQLVVPGDWKERVANGEVVAEATREWQMSEHPGHFASVVAIFRDGGVMDSHGEFVKAAQTGIPSLAVLGGLDGLCNQRQLNEQGIENVVVIPQVGHAVVRERAAEVGEFIINFWNRLD